MYVNDILGWEGATLNDYWHKWDEIDKGRQQWQKKFANYRQATPWVAAKPHERKPPKFDPKKWYPEDGKKGPKQDLQDRLEALLYGGGSDETFGSYYGPMSGAAIGDEESAFRMFDDPLLGGETSMT